MRRKGSAHCPSGNPVVRYVALQEFLDAPYCHDCSLLQPAQRCPDLRPAADSEQTVIQPGG